jgi:uncharacterized protein
MKTRQFTFQSSLPVSAEEAYHWHIKPGALKRSVPPWKRVKLLSSASTPEKEGSLLHFKLRWGPFKANWILKQQHCIPNQEFSVVQLKGPFRTYSHVHRITPIDALSCNLVDEVTYSLPFFLSNSFVQKEMLRYMTWRHALLQADLKTYDRYPRKPLRILLSGASGFIGSGLKNFLELGGHQVISLVRHKKNLPKDAIYWDPISGDVESKDFEGFDAVIHLAGASIAEGRWTKKRRQELFSSRCRDTWLLSQVLCRLYQTPKTVICASAIGIYGDRGDEVLTEESSPGEGFLADLCVHWEKATETIENRGARVVHPRFGVVIGANGGMLSKLLPIYRLGLGGKIGSGNQIISWIGIDDLFGGIYHCLMKESIRGAVNLTAPNPLPQREFAKLLAKNVGRPAIIPMPAAFLKMGLGRDKAQEIILSSQNVKPEKLLKTGYVFRDSDLKTVLLTQLDP